MDRRRLFPFAVGGALGLSVAASVAAGWDAAPTDYELLCLLTATTAAFLAAVVQPDQKKCLLDSLDWSFRAYR